MTAIEYVLVVDDDADARVLTAAVVRTLELEVRLAQDGNEALEIVRKAAPAFVILDLMLPGMSGFSLLRHLQQNPKTLDVPILIITGATLKDYEVPDLRGTVVGLLRKGDFDMDTLLAYVKGGMANSE